MSQQRDYTCGWNHSYWRTGPYLTCMINIIAVDGLVTKGADQVDNSTDQVLPKYFDLGMGNIDK